MNSHPSSLLTSRPVRAPLLVSRLTAFLFLLSVALLPAQASAGGDLRIGLVAHRILVGPDGSEVRDDRGAAEPGDVIEYVATYRNNGGGEIRDLAPVLPIPAGLRLIESSATPQPSEASLDGKVFAPLAEVLAASAEDPAGGIRALRWQVGDLAAGESAVIVTRVVLEANR